MCNVGQLFLTHLTEVIALHNQNRQLKYERFIFMKALLDLNILICIQTQQ